MAARLRAFALHLLISGLLAAASAGLVFWLWYPGPFATASGIQRIYLIILLVDLVLGPAITLVIFDTRKKGRRELMRDVSIIGCIQVAALFYGLHTAYVARPAYIVYSMGRFDLAFAHDIPPARLQLANAAYGSLPLTGPNLVGAEMPQDPKAKGKVLDSALSGTGDLPEFPQYYVPYEGLRKEVIQHAEPLEKLQAFNPKRQADIAGLVKHYASVAGGVGFLPLKVKDNAVTVVVSKSTGEVLGYHDLMPWL